MCATANHEGSSISGGTDEIFGANGIAGLTQNASVTVRTAAENILAINYRGVAAIAKRAGSADLTIEGIYTKPSGIGKDLYQYVDAIDPVIIKTSDGSQAKGKYCTVSGIYVTGVSANFVVQDNASMSWTYVADKATWAVDQAAVTPILGTGHNFVPVQFDDIVVEYDSVIASGLQSARFDGTIDRSDIYQIGQTTPIDRPVSFPFGLTVTIETLAEESQKVQDFVTDFDWNAYEGGDGIIVSVRQGTCEGGVTAAAGYYAAIASGLRPSDATMNISVGDNSTITATFEGWNFWF